MGCYTDAGVGSSRWPDSTESCAGDHSAPCDNSGEDGDLVDAPLDYTDDGTVITDQVTGLVWDKQVAGAGTARSEAQTHCQTKATANYAGYSDWRLPKLVELLTLVDYGRADPAAHSALSQPAAFFWSAQAKDANSGFGVNFSAGLGTWWNIGFPGNTNARCVRGQLAGGAPQRTGCSPATVYDPRTNLEWQQQANGTARNWVKSIEHCESLGDGWRTPNAKELASILDLSSRPAYVSAFTGEPSEKFWSSTPVRGSSTQSWVVDFGISGNAVGGVVGPDLRAANRLVRCVRTR